VGQIAALSADTAWQSAMQSGVNTIVESVFRRALNLVAPDGSLLTIHSRDGLHGPGSLLTDLEDCRLLGKVGDEIEISSSSINLDGRLVKLDTCVFYSSRRLPIQTQPKIIAVDWLEKELSKKATSSSFWSQADDYFSQAISKKLNLARRDFLQDPNSIKSASQLIGLGIGLTPTGDDYLLGFLAVTKLSAHRTEAIDKLSGNIRELMTRTTRISQHFLKAATENQFSDLTYDFLVSMENGQKDQKALEALMSYGASSGSDIATGMLDAWKILTKTGERNG